MAPALRPGAHSGAHSTAARAGSPGTSPTDCGAKPTAPPRTSERSALLPQLLAVLPAHRGDAGRSPRPRVEGSGGRASERLRGALGQAVSLPGWFTARPICPMAASPLAFSRALTHSLAANSAQHALLLPSWSPHRTPRPSNWTSPAPAMNSDASAPGGRQERSPVTASAAAPPPSAADESSSSPLSRATEGVIGAVATAAQTALEHVLSRSSEPRRPSSPPAQSPPPPPPSPQLLQTCMLQAGHRGARDSQATGRGRGHLCGRRPPAQRPAPGCGSSSSTRALRGWL